MPENVNLAESSDGAVDGGQRELSGTGGAFRGEAADDAAGRDIAAEALDGQLLAVERHVELSPAPRTPRRPNRRCRS